MSHSVTYLEYKRACRVVYAFTLSHISDNIRELELEPWNFLLLTENYISFSKATLNIHGKVNATWSPHKGTKMTPSSSRVK